MKFAHAFPASLALAALLTMGPATGFVGPGPAHAQEPPSASDSGPPKGLWLTTPYPMLSAQAGEEVSIDLSLTNEGLPPQRVTIGIDGLPEGWTYEVTGGGRQIGAAMASPDSTRDMTLKITPLADAEKRVYEFEVTATGGSQDIVLPIAVTLTETQPAQLTLEPELPALRGTVRSTFDFQVEIKNDGQEDTVVNLLAEAPSGFEVTFKERYGSNELTSLPLKAGESKNLSVGVKPPESMKAGQYPVQIAASGDGATAQSQLVLDITGRPELALAGPGGRLSGNAVAGQERSFTFTIENRGTAPAKQVEFSSSPPSGWEVAFEPEQIEELPSGETAEVKVKMTPSEKAIAGDYVVSLRANGDGASDNASFRVTVETSTVWGVAGLGVIAAAVAVLGFAISRYGRR
ncbi:putative repeat protein (TIGR01451 family) [Mesorhizobium sp. J18]|uniref:COG1470 family protein n=1 Tax=Mesorhizobium sp. J18 TaxID=935263 RepID=UPI00119A7575|nr:NEW3 domain-containing protein [Mesorhizobium sp. J18]TWG92453.1 putative repeat protein (TIGR01451 family) [Mesorhizobium sp. J18]